MSNFPCGHVLEAANTDNYSGKCRACRIARQKKYRLTEKGKACYARYEHSLLGRIRKNSYASRKRMEGSIA